MMSLPAANRPSKDIFCRLQAVSCCLFLKTLDLTLLARQDADFFVNHQDDMKHYLGVGNPNLNLHLWPCLMASWWGFSGGIDPNQKNQLHPWSFFFFCHRRSFLPRWAYGMWARWMTRTCHGLAGSLQRREGQKIQRNDHVGWWFQVVSKVCWEFCWPPKKCVQV